MSNLFGFSYDTKPVANLDGTDSRFVNIWGQGGNVVHTGKVGYKMISTDGLSLVGNSLIDRGLEVRPFVHRHGEQIGLNIKLKGTHMTAVGDKSYEALITCPNNGTGRGYLSLREVRLVCTNGLVRSTTKRMSIKIPHTLNYPQALELAGNAIIEFKTLIEESALFDAGLSEKKLNTEEVRFHLNKWFFYNELPPSQKPDGFGFDDFRELVSVGEGDEIEFKFLSRYRQLISAYQAELGHNETLGLGLSQYTVLASVTNYLSRRVETSNSSAPKEVQYLRQQTKTDKLINQLVKA